MKHNFTAMVFENTDLSEKERTLLNQMPLVKIARTHGAISKREKHLYFRGGTLSFEEKELLQRFEEILR